MVNLIALLVGGVVILAGGGVIKHGFTLRKQRNLVEETPTEEIESVSMGQSEIKGTARPAEQGTTTAPFTDDECLVAVWEVEEFDVTHDPDGPDDRSWHTKGTGLDAVPFFVDDGTGQALVRPSKDAEFEIDQEAEEPILVEAGETPPERIETFLERDDWEGLDVTTHGTADVKFGERSGYSEGDRRYIQHLIRPGEDVYVFGVAQQRSDVQSADNPANVVIEKVPEEDADLEDMFMISDRSEEEIVEERGGAMWYLPGGALLATIGFAILLWGIGLF